MAEGWRFRLLGPLEVRHDGELVPIAAAKQRVLVAVLALASTEPVTVDRLIACLWGDEPPATARNTLQNHVLRLRRALQVDDAPDPVVTSAAGYHLEVTEDAVDVGRFQSALRYARAEAAAGEVESAAALLDEALGLWRGEPLADVPSDVLHREVVPGLAEQRLAALEQRMELGLRLGRHRELVTELVALTTRHPLRERMWGQLMLALYRCGRTGEALAAYRRAGTVLADELGIDPGPELQALHQAVLTNDPALTIPDPVPQTSAPRPAVPRQLPAPTGQFVGRADELRALSARLTDARGAALMVISAIGGSAGIGKTTLALRWAHQHADRFPDGQLYVNLRGFDPTGAPLPPAAAVRGFLTALGVPAQQIPAQPDEQIALYRSQLADRRMLIVLDNARDAEQVRPLLPGAPGSLVLVTSRDQLASLIALDGAWPLTLDLLTRAEARELLARRLGHERVARERAAVDELIETCARLPLALTIAAAHAALHPTRPLATLVAELRDARRRLDTLTAGEPAADVRAVFSWSYRTLTPAAARTFRLLGVHPGPDISRPAVAGLTGADPDDTRRALDELTRAHLITERTPGRHTVHDLLRAYAADQAHTHDSDTERQDALRRLCDFYTHTAHAAGRLLDPHRTPIGLAPSAPGVSAEPVPDAPAAMAWFDAEHPNLLATHQAAVSHAWHPIVWQLAWTLDTFHHRRGFRHDQLLVWQAGLDATAHLPDPSARILAHRLLGRAHADLGRHQEGIDHLRQALVLAEEHRDTGQQAHTHGVLGRAWGQLGDDRQALRHAIRSRELYHALDQPVGEADALNAMGWYAARLGEYDTARTHCRAALALHRQHHNAEGEANTLDSLGYIAHLSGHHQLAIPDYQQALTLFRALGNTNQAVDTLDALGHPHLALGDHEQARAVWQEALATYRLQERDQDADRVRRQLDALDSRVRH